MSHRLLFDDRFADLVESGAKTQTIRRLHDELPRPGDRLQLCRAHSAPVLFTILNAVCTSVQPLRIYKDRPTWTAVELDGEYLILTHIRDLALADGFARTMDFLRYFERKGLPFEGVLIKWAARPEHPHTPPPMRECCTCKHEGKSIKDWPCRTSMNAVGLMCWEPKEAHNGTART
ncbi:MAG: hypothetical protein AB9900_05000 [Humidesulfovibrio sp.]